MKKAYFKPEIEITDFTTEDIITASSVTGFTKKDDIVNVNGLTSVDLNGADWH